MDREARPLSLSDRRIENRGRNQSVNMQAQQCISGFTKGRQEAEINQRAKERGEKDVAVPHVHVL